MYANHQNKTREDLVREVQELEDSYAEALADEIDAPSLSLLWQRIKTLHHQIEENKEDHRDGPTHIR